MHFHTFSDAQVLPTQRVEPFSFWKAAGSLKAEFGTVSLPPGGRIHWHSFSFSFSGSSRFAERFFICQRVPPVKHRSTFEVALILDGFGKGLLCVCLRVVNVLVQYIAISGMNPSKHRLTTTKQEFIDQYAWYQVSNLKLINYGDNLEKKTKNGSHPIHPLQATY